MDFVLNAWYEYRLRPNIVSKTERGGQLGMQILHEHRGCEMRAQVANHGQWSTETWFAYALLTQSLREFEVPWNMLKLEQHTTEQLGMVNYPIFIDISCGRDFRLKNPNLLNNVASEQPYLFILIPFSLFP